MLIVSLNQKKKSDKAAIEKAKNLTNEFETDSMLDGVEHMGLGGIPDTPRKREEVVNTVLKKNGYDPEYVSDRVKSYMDDRLRKLVREMM